MPPIAENKERSLPQILAQAFTDQCLQPIEALAQVHRLQRHEYLQPTGEAQHRARPPCATSLINSATMANCVGDSMSTRLPPGSSTWSVPVASELRPSPSTASNSRTVPRPAKVDGVSGPSSAARL